MMAKRWGKNKDEKLRLMVLIIILRELATDRSSLANYINNFSAINLTLLMLIARLTRKVLHRMDLEFELMTYE